MKKCVIKVEKNTLIPEMLSLTCEDLNYYREIDKDDLLEKQIQLDNLAKSKNIELIWE